MVSMSAFLRFYAVFCGVCVVRIRVVAFFVSLAVTIALRAPGLWDSGVLGPFSLFLRFSARSG